MRPKRIVFTGDIFRTSEARHPDQLVNALWLKENFAAQIEACTGLSSEIRFWGRSPNPAVVTEAYAALGRQPSYQDWAAVFDEAATPRLAEIFAADYEDAIVVGIELPPVVERMLDLIGVSWVGLQISPLRFLRDWAVSVRGSEHIDFASAARFTLTPEDVAAAVDRVRKYYGTGSVGLDGAMLFCAQTSIDRSLIEPAGFYPAERIVDDLRRAAGGGRIFVKPHPIEPDTKVVRLVQGDLHGEIITGDIYRLLSSADRFGVAAISSSVLAEAQAFGRHTFRFASPLTDHQKPAMVTLHSQSTDLWRALLSRFAVAGKKFEFVKKLRAYVDLGQEIEQAWR
jgi:hypothetical protein